MLVEPLLGPGNIKRFDDNGSVLIVPRTPQENLAVTVFLLGSYIEEARRDDPEYHGQITVFDLWDPLDPFNDEGRSTQRLFNEEEG
jgi:hypothetical protein